MTERRIAILFPGQGVLDAQALKVFRAHPGVLRSVFDGLVERTRRPYGDGHAGAGPASSELARRALHFDLAIYLASLAAHDRLHRRGLGPHVLIGHGFGEIAALVASGAFTVIEGAEIVAARCAVLAAQAAAGLMMTTVQAPPETVCALLDMLAPRGLALACENSSRSSVLVGSPDASAAAAGIARKWRIRIRQVKTPSGSAHHPSMSAARGLMASTLGHIKARPMRRPVYSPLRARFYRSDDDVIGCLAGQLAQPIRFADAISNLARDGRIVVECGPLRGLARMLDCDSVSDEEYRSEHVECDAALHAPRAVA